LSVESSGFESGLPAAFPVIHPGTASTAPNKTWHLSWRQPPRTLWQFDRPLSAKTRSSDYRANDNPRLKTMARTALTVDEANLQLAPLAHMPVSAAWKGYGTTIFLELGNLSLEDRRRGPKGEVTIYVSWDWRVAKGSRVLFGSSNSSPEMADGIATLVGLTVDNVTIQGTVPELSMVFSDGAGLQSAAMCTDTSEWDVSLPNNIWISCMDGIVYAGDGSGIALSAEEQGLLHHADVTAQRWGIPVAPAPAGRCGQCAYMRRIDESGPLLDFGVCTSAESPLDGRVVNDASGCAVFFAKPIR
jgi:hypothetical protein